MTSLCPDWAALLRERERAERSSEIGGATVDAAWEDALRHREGCERCRATSLAADPLLLFSGFSARDTAAGDTAARDTAAGAEENEVSAGEIDAIRQRVRLELDGRATERRLNEARSARRRRLPVASVLAAGAAAAALGLSFLLWPETAPPADGIADAPPALPDHIAMAPLVEPLGDEPLHVYQLPGNDGDGLDVVLVVAP